MKGPDSSGHQRMLFLHQAPTRPANARNVQPRSSSAKAQRPSGDANAPPRSQTPTLTSGGRLSTPSPGRQKRPGSAAGNPTSNPQKKPSEDRSSSGNRPGSANPVVGRLNIWPNATPPNSARAASPAPVGSRPSSSGRYNPNDKRASTPTPRTASPSPGTVPLHTVGAKSPWGRKQPGYHPNPKQTNPSAWGTAPLSPKLEDASPSNNGAGSSGDRRSSSGTHTPTSGASSGQDGRHGNLTTVISSALDYKKFLDKRKQMIQQQVETAQQVNQMNTGQRPASREGVPVKATHGAEGSSGLASTTAGGTSEAPSDPLLPASPDGNRAPQSYLARHRRTTSGTGSPANAVRQHGPVESTEEVHLPGSINNDKDDNHSDLNKEHHHQAKMAFPSVEGGNKGTEVPGLDDTNAGFPPCSGRGTESANSSCTRMGSATPNGRMVREIPQQHQAPGPDSRPQSRMSAAGNRERAPSRFGSKGGIGADDEEQGSLDGGEGVLQGTDQFSHGGVSGGLTGNAQHRGASEGARRVPEKKESLSDLLGEDGKDVRWSSNQGSSLEDYIVGKQIGQGAYATVRFGIHKDTGRKVAVKVYEKYKLLDPQRRKSVRREIKLMERMSHPNMVAFHDALDTPKQIYIIMEFVGGGSLHHYLKKHTCRRVEETKAKRLFYQVCQGIKYCHDRHIVHRDVKLENLLLDENGTVKIIDFGFSTIIPPGKKLKTFCGTPSYMAPEIVARKEYSGFCADIWAMGVLLYALLCGCFPFKGQNDKDLYRKIVKGVFYIPEFVSQSSRALVTRILTVDMNRRPTVDEVLADPWFTSHPTELYALKNSHQPNISVSSQSTTAGERTSGQTASSSSGQSASDPASAALAFPRRGSSGQDVQPSRPASSHGMSSGSGAQVAQFGRSSPAPPAEVQQRPQSSERPQTPNGYGEAPSSNSGTRASSARASREKSARIEEEAMAKLERLGYPREEIVRQLKDESSHLYKLYFRFLKAMNAWDQK